MLPKTDRIKKKKDFEKIFRKAKSFKNNLFISKITKNSLRISRFGFVVSQKISKKATVRNKTRRRMAQIIKALKKDIKNGLDVVLIALPGIEKKDFKEVNESLKNLLSSTGLISSNGQGK